MTRLSGLLADYVIRKGIVSEDDRRLYEYGFTVALEVGLFAVICIIIMVISHMYLEGILFFIVFAPLRSYAGGLHLRKYSACLALSVLTFCGILCISKVAVLPIVIADIVSATALLGIYLLYPVENANRDVDSEENQYFKKKLKMVLIMDCLLLIVFNIFYINQGIMVTAYTLFMVCFTMVLGKCAGQLHRPS